VWEEYRGLNRLETGNHKQMTWNGRGQHFQWINPIEYRYGDNDKKKQLVHVVVCKESWEDIDANGHRVEKTSRHAWLSSKPLSRQNVHERCNLGARHRWGIEEELLVEKRHGYQYEHCFCEDWNAMRGYHYLLRIGHLINILVWYSSALSRALRNLGIRGMLEFIWTTLVGPWFDAEAVRANATDPGSYGSSKTRQGVSTQQTGARSGTGVSNRRPPGAALRPTRYHETQFVRARPPTAA
jgi:hypothetical protein